jgi:iron complex transport system substrate-binding protein
MDDDALTHLIIDEAIRIHRRIGPGAFERSYSELLARALIARGVAARREVPFPIEYHGKVIPLAYRVDILVNDRVIIEVKSSDQNHPVYRRQVLTYLRHTNLQTGLVINFGKDRLTDGIQRVRNGWH